MGLLALASMPVLWAELAFWDHFQFLSPFPVVSVAPCFSHVHVIICLMEFPLGTVMVSHNKATVQLGAR